VIPNPYNTPPVGASSFEKKLRASVPKSYRMVYPDERSGIQWQLRLDYYTPGYLQHHPDADKPCSISATINPKLLIGIKDYIAAANSNYLDDVENAFNREATRLSHVLGTFDFYELNRADYCINFDLKEMGIDCTPELMMKLLERGNIPTHFNQFTKFDKISRRHKKPPNSFYISSNSVTVNCYSKGFQLMAKDPLCTDVNNALNVIRFEVQCKYPKIKAMQRNLLTTQGLTGTSLLDEMLSDEVCNNVITRYFNKVLRGGDYVTLDKARKIIENQNFNKRRENRLVDALELISRCRGIAGAKAVLKQGEQERFRWALRELETIGLNPVTIPREWGINYIPNLLDAYRQSVLGLQQRREKIYTLHPIRRSKRRKLPRKRV
jgi:hypothetical protein